MKTSIPIREVCDGVDEDYDGLIDNEPVIDISGFDADGDGFGNLNVEIVASSRTSEKSCC